MLRGKAVLPFEKALEIVRTSAHQLDTERIEFGRALNRVLAEDVKSDMNIMALPISMRCVTLMVWSVWISVCLKLKREHL